MSKIQNLSELLISVDPNVLVYNGSLLPIPNSNLFICAYRATYKPDKDLPPYPYQQYNSDNWFNKNNYVGIAVLNSSKTKIVGVAKYIHNTKLNQTNIDLYKKLSKISEHNFKLLLTGPEDPRLYIKNGEIYMNYNDTVLTPEADCQGICTSMFEIKIDLKVLKNNFGKYYPENQKKLICRKIDDEMLFKKNDVFIQKNWSYSPKYFIDSYNDSSFLYKLIDSDVENCTKEKQNFNLTKQIQKEWKISLTTPTVEYKGNMYGVAHIRVKWSDMALFFNKLSEDIQEIIYKNDIHNGDFYFMSIYIIYEGKWRLSSPILLTGDVSEKYYSYNVNFPCGFFIKDDKVNITLGVGDCLLYLYTNLLSNIEFKNKKLNYSDINVIKVKNKLLEKKYINQFICSSKLQLKNYLLPAHIRLFDLGGSGLRSVSYTSKTDVYSSEIRFNRDNKNLLPDEIIRQFDNINKNINIENETINGWGFGFALAGIRKLWKGKQSKEYKLLKKRNYDTTAQIFNLIDSEKIISLKDSHSHLFGVLNEIENQHNKNTSNLNILNIAIGTGMNISYWQHGDIKDYETSVSPNTYFWDIKLEGDVKIRNIFKKLDKCELKHILRVFLRLEENDIGMTSLFPESWELPDVITLTGGGSKKYEVYSNIKVCSSKYFSNCNKDIYLNVYPEKLIPYKGIIWKFKHDFCN